MKKKEKNSDTNMMSDEIGLPIDKHEKRTICASSIPKHKKWAV